MLNCKGVQYVLEGCSSAGGPTTLVVLTVDDLDQVSVNQRCIRLIALISSKQAGMFGKPAGLQTSRSKLEHSCFAVVDAALYP